MTISSGNITDEIIQKYIEDQEGEPVEIGQFEIDSTLIPPQLKAEGCLVGRFFLCILGVMFFNNC